MKPGDLLEFKDGTLGLSGNDLYGIYLGRAKRGKNYVYSVFTRKGWQEVAQDRVKGAVAKARVAGVEELTNDELRARLDQLVADVATAAEATADVADVPDELRDRDVWEALEGSTDPVTAGEAARQLFGDNATKGHVNKVKEALDACRFAGVGYFEPAEGRGDRWRPLPNDEVKRARREADAFRKLRNRLIRIREEEDEDGRIERIVEGVPVDEATLDEGDEDRLAVVADVMRDFVLHDRERNVVTLPGTGVHTIDGFRLSTFTRFLAQDWLGETSATISGSYVRFLVDAALMTPEAAIRLVAERMVLDSEHFATEYPERALKAAERFERAIPDDEVAARDDLRGLETYTIDPPDAKDFDDAISVEALDGGATRLHVHIADVSHYVRPGSPLETEARTRGTSVYLPIGVLPMLPPRLADDLCSLRAGEDRLAMSVSMTVTADGDVTDEHVRPTVIHVDRNLAYDDVIPYFDEGREPFATMHAVARRLAERRIGLSLETDELKVHIEEDVVDPHLKAPNEATRMIERFMVAANEAVARFLTARDVPLPYRCHPMPERSRVEDLNRQLEVMELPFRVTLPEPREDEEDEDEAGGDALLEALKGGGKLSLVTGGFIDDERGGPSTAEDAEDAEGEPGGGGDRSGLPTMKGIAQLDPDEREAWLQPFNAIVEHVMGIEDPRFRDIVFFKLLQTMGRALYTPDNIGHFGLGSVCYCHFTSPIRRYPDLVVHRQVKALVAAERDGLDEPELVHDADELGDLCPVNSDQAVAAERLERDLINVALAFKARAGDLSGTHEALVNGLTQGGVFLSLASGVEARLATSDVPGGPWAVDDASSMLFKGEIEDPTLGVGRGSDWRELMDAATGEMIDVKYRLGDSVRVRISDYDLATGRLRAKLAEVGEE